MPGFAPRRLVLVKAVLAGARGEAFSVGTGYFVTADLVLTASHVVPEQGRTGLEVRLEDAGEWHEAEPVWRDVSLDAVLLRIATPLPDTPEVAWVEADFDANAPWESSGYPDAGKVIQDDKPLWKTVGLDGTLKAYGGGGQGSKELELTVDAPPKATGWAGISGAPVFVGERLAGFIKEVPESFQGGRLAATPATSLLQSAGFRLILSPPWLETPPSGVWVLVVLAERGRAQLADWVDGALVKHSKVLEEALGAGPIPKARRVRITDALASPGHWLRFVQALCAAPVAIFDATGFESAVMLALGVRSVVRRGVTLTSTAETLTPAHLSQMPFNIQETKLIYHGSEVDPNDVKHPLNMIAAAIKKGWQELSSQPSYLDLPAYDAVRCPYPSAVAVERLLMLCSFDKSHTPNWLYVVNTLAAHFPDRPAARMLDIDSPRLVGQALYEGIRWARTCVVDWTGWRANVFFEMGVRLACADVGPVGLIEQSEAAAAAEPGAPTQRLLLMTLFGPSPYRKDEDDNSIDDALLIHKKIVEQRPPAISVSQLPHDATYRACLDRFEWKSEHITIEPHELLRTSIEAPFGKDRQARGLSPILFSANAEYSKDLGRSVKERWIAAWYYLANRYPEARWSEDPGLRATLLNLANEVLLFGLPDPSEDHLKALRDRIYNVIDQLEKLDKRQATDGENHANTD
jgi:hypothetical protein